jgi:heavy metal translocating P-type ATPase
MRRTLLPVAALAFIAAGAIAGTATVLAPWRAPIWMLGLAVTGTPVAWRTLRAAFAGHFATDLVAMLAITGALALGEPLAGLVVVLMQTGGEALERYAEGRASDAVRALEADAPRVAHRLAGDRLTDIDADAIVIGDQLLVRPGELIPCDCEVTIGQSHVDASRLTGEPTPVTVSPGAKLSSGGSNLDGALTVRALARAHDSQYARIVELVRTAQASKSPLQRLADRYAIWFTPLTLAVCAVTFLLTRDAARVLAVLVVATPCPLILATPIAIIGGINRAARRQIIVRHGAALEQLGDVTTAVFDKTGTLTIGHPRVGRVRPAAGISRALLLRLAGAVEQSSGHALARPLVEAALADGGSLPAVTEIRETPGRGVEGTADGHHVVVGAAAYVAERAPAAGAELATMYNGEVALRALVAFDGRAAGIVEYADALRPGVAGVIRELAQLGLSRMMLVSGDHSANTRAVAQEAGIGEWYADLLPGDKVKLVGDRVRQGERVVMVGDGTNDAPALSTATVGIALAAHGGGITAEAADIVILADDLHRVADAIRISRRTMRIAHQSIWAGLGLSALAMVIAAFGYIPATVGAMLQEAIDVAVIVNALRTSR